MTIDQNFSQKCNVSDLGYEPATPDSAAADLGYGLAEPDTARYSTADDLGYGTAEPDVAKYGYGSSTPSTDQYGYGDATPDTTKYGYEQTAADLGYEDPDAASNGNPYGYGHQEKDDPLTKLSSHSTPSVDYGYGDDNGSSGEPRRRRERPRRRGSVTKYSLDAQDQVQQEFDAHSQAIAQIRDGANDGVPPPPPPPRSGVETVPLKGDGDGTPLRSRKLSGDAGGGDMSEDDGLSVDDMSCEDPDGMDKKKKKKRFGRFRIGRNRSGMSTGSNASTGSED